MSDGFDERGMRGRLYQIACAAGLAFVLGLVVVVPAAAEPRTDYILHCQGCHGPAGEGAPGGVPSFRDQVGKFLDVPGGREFLLRVPGVSQSELSDARVAALVNWIVDEFGPAPIAFNVLPFSAAEVARLRRPPLTDVAGVRRRLIQAIRRLEEHRAGGAALPSAP